MNKRNDIDEYYFSDFYRTIVVKSGENEYMVSVDVYKKTDRCALDNQDIKYTCVEDTCLIIEEVKPTLIPKSIATIGINKVLVIGIRVSDNCEVINVKWFVNRKPTFEDVKAMFDASWWIISHISGISR
ncbi:MAG: hypothetical protein QXU22_04280 [Desulfurococcaceae archaeon]